MLTVSAATWQELQSLTPRVGGSFLDEFDEGAEVLLQVLWTSEHVRSAKPTASSGFCQTGVMEELPPDGRRCLSAWQVSYRANRHSVWHFGEKLSTGGTTECEPDSVEVLQTQPQFTIYDTANRSRPTLTVCQYTRISDITLRRALTSLHVSKPGLPVTSHLFSSSCSSFE